MYRRLLHRMAMFAAIVAVTAGMTTTGRAGPVLPTPSGLAPGDSFRFVFVTTDGTTATSSNISDYDTFVTAQADGATYNGSVITWQAIGSTASVSAIDHIGTNPGISGVYLVNGTQIASSDGTSSGGLWSGSIFAPISLDINSLAGPFLAWTGTQSNGTIDFPGELGSLIGDTSRGITTATNSNWVDSGGSFTTQSHGLYGISGVLLVPTASIPEPSSLVLAGIASMIGLVLAGTRPPNEQVGQGTAGPTDESS